MLASFGNETPPMVIPTCPNMGPEPSNSENFCPPTTDIVPWLGEPVAFCWNYTAAGRVAHYRCPNVEGMNHYEYATKYCTSNGTWAIHPFTNRTFMNLLSCVEQEKTFVAYIYWIGYSVSILALAISLIIFASFRQLHCDRLTIHIHLFTCYLLNAVIWIIFYVILGYTPAVTENWTSCKILHLIASYFSVAMYMWMFNEGLYLVVILVITFISSGKKLLMSCMFIGWIIPLLLTILYGTVRWTVEDPIACWTPASHLLYIVHVPTIISLALNFVFVVVIFIVLITKLRNPVSPDQQQGRKAAKAIVILVPLLGIQYIFTLVKADTGVMAYAHDYVVAVLASSQGLLVAVLFCFINQEVHSAVARHFGRRRYNAYDESASMNRRVSRAAYASRLDRTEQTALSGSANLKLPAPV